MKTSNRLFKRLRNSHGFSMAEVMVAAGMLGIVSLGLMKMTEQSTQQQKKIKTDFNVTSIFYRLNQVNKSADSCENTLGGLNISGLDATPVPINIVLRDKDNNPLISNGDTVGSGSGGAVTITNVQIVEANPAVVTTGGVNPYELKIRVFMTYGKGANLKNLNKDLTMNVYDNDGNGIINFATDSCETTAVNKAASCDILGGRLETDPFGVERCTNIDVANVIGGVGVGENRHFGIMSRGGIGITEDAANHYDTPAIYWSMTPTNASPSILQVKVDDDRNPNSNATTMLEIGANASDGANSTFATYADSQTLALNDGTAVLRITSNQNVGVGTSNPADDFHVYDATQDQVARFESGDNNAAIAITDSTGSVQLQTTSNGELRFKTGGAANSNGTGSTTNMTITEGGNVGIGTTNPNRKLYVDQDASGSNIAMFSGDATWGSTIQLHNSTSASTWNIITGGSGYPNSGGLNFHNGANRVSITPSGSVGIGTTSPTGRLEIVGGDAYLVRTADQIGRATTGDCTAAGQANCKIVNRAWVYRTLAGSMASQLTAGQRQNIVEHILQNSTSTGSWTAMKTDVKNDFSVTHSPGEAGYTAPGGTTRCPSGQFVDRILYNGSGQIIYSCTASSACSSKENCANVYAGSGGLGKLCARTAAGVWKCVSANQNTWPTSCTTILSSGSVGAGWNSVCDGNRMVRGVNTRSNGRIEIRCCVNRIMTNE